MRREARLVECERVIERERVRVEARAWSARVCAESAHSVFFFKKASEFAVAAHVSVRGENVFVEKLKVRCASSVR